VPERLQIDLHGCRPPLLIQLAEHRHTGGAVAAAQCLAKLPALLERASILEDRTQRILQAEVIVTALADLDIGDQAEQRATPIGACPARRVVETAILRARQSIGHLQNKLSPDTLRRELPGTGACDWPYIGGCTLL
jgi:hypothetical protein